jgi:nifR3 family TIM-barrel protein
MMNKVAFFIDNVPVYGKLILSPMDGYSDQPFRSMVRHLGSSMSYTEFINAIDVVHHHPFLEKRISFLETERPVVFQFLDNDIDRLEKAIFTLLDHRPDIIDINLGCSSKKVTERGAGASLLRDPQKIAAIFSRLSNKLNIPLTAKIRLGWDEESKNYLEIAKSIQDNGGKLVAVHGRTKKQGYTGNANWDAIAEIKQILSIPVIGNGDVTDVTGIDRMLDYTNCDGVMIGRAAIKNPWIFSRLDIDQVPVDVVLQTFLNHLDNMIVFYGEELGIKFFRKYIAKFIDHYPLSREDRRSFLTQEDKSLFSSDLDKIIRQYHNTVR